MIEIFDGAMGTMLQQGGLKAGACPELMNIESPEVVKKYTALTLTRAQQLLKQIHSAQVL